jgi:bacterioferritin-associated ferredoxin
VYFCICNGLTESRVRAAVDETGAKSVAAVYRYCGVIPRCGKCIETIRDYVQTRRTVECAAAAHAMMAAE